MTNSQAPQPAQKAQLVDALEDALSVCCSVDRSKGRTVEHGGCTMHLQTAEWCAWLENEVAPKIEKVLADLASNPAVPARDSDKQLMNFYSVESLHALIDAQEEQIRRLQAKLPPINQPAFTRVREG